jgi:predicted nucleic acid-binding protein
VLAVEALHAPHLVDAEVAHVLRRHAASAPVRSAHRSAAPTASAARTSRAPISPTSTGSPR